MNAEVAGVLSEAIKRILQCSEAFALVPRPPGFVPGLGYLLQYWKNLRDYFLVVKDNRTYRASGAGGRRGAAAGPGAPECRVRAFRGAQFVVGAALDDPAGL